MRVYIHCVWFFSLQFITCNSVIWLFTVISLPDFLQFYLLWTCFVLVFTGTEFNVNEMRQTLTSGNWRPSRLSVRTTSVFTIHSITRLCSHISWILLPLLCWWHPTVSLARSAKLWLFSVSAPHWWNELLTNVRTAVSLSISCKRLSCMYVIVCTCMFVSQHLCT